MSDLQTIIEKPDIVVLPLPTRSHPEWQGQTLGDILKTCPDEGLRLLEFLADGYEGDFHLKLAAAILLARRHRWGPFAGGNGKAVKSTKKAKKAGIPGLTGAVLKQAISHLRKVVYAKATLPVLRCIHIEQTPEALVLSSTNLETSLRLTLPFGGEGEWKALAEAKTLGSAVKAIGTGKTHEVSLTHDGNALHLTGPRGTTLVPTPISPDEFPLALADVAQPIAAIHGLDLGLMTAVATAASTDPARPVLMTVFVDLEQGTVVAADGFRMAFAPVPVEVQVGVQEDDGDKIPPLLIPAKSVKIAGQVMDGIEEVHIMHHSSASRSSTYYALFTGPARVPGGRMEVGGLLTERPYPDWPQIVPKPESVPVTFQVDVAQALEAVKGLLPAAKESAYLTIFEVDEATLRMTVSSIEVGTQVAEMPATAQNGRTRWAANATYVADALKALKGLGVEMATFKVGRVTFDGEEYHLPRHPFIIKGGPLTWIVMPMSAHEPHGEVAPWEDPEAKLEYAHTLAQRHLAEWAASARYSVPTEHEREDLIEAMARRMVEKDMYDPEKLYLIRNEVLK